MIATSSSDLEPIQERRREIDARPSLVRDVLADGKRRAHAVASETMARGPRRDRPGLIA